MGLKDRITDDMKAAMRAKDSARLGAIRLLLAAIKQREVDERITLDDAGVVAVVDKLLKQRRDAIAAYEQAGRTDLADKERAEVEVLQAYLPARLDAAGVARAVQSIVARLSAELGRAPTPADMGKAMALAKAELAGQADMAEVSAAVKAALAR
ncbi:GatB/YqeY domain-containing protein [Tepidimonas charontis]|uniref:Yqey-like protein n=1 Tax=Tepidimonas charontis TaxID=2267262 RepID=A0A554XHT0_9BURK|nr:GatB/YqeY domain-containing protein [Tepidimonas charontis]TSE35382.1 Yqey-like protein [Tepidimonas charontis]